MERRLSHGLAATLPDRNIATLRAVSKAPSKPPRAAVKTTVELPAELWRAAKIRAMDDQTDLRTVLIRALERYLGPRETGPRGGRSE